MRIILGVGGGIAAYKAAELARILGRRGHSVQVLMTSAAEQFITPLTFAALTGRKVITNLFASEGHSDEATLSSAVEHIAVASDNDLFLVAPATADLLAKFAHGLASDFLTTAYLAFDGPVVLAPAMNTKMWDHPATVANLNLLRGRGHVLVEPASGLLACGTTGPGRLAEPEEIAAAVDRAFESQASARPNLTPTAQFAGETILITAGPTREPLDPVRYISNRSSGKMGYALAEAALERGASVILVSGPVQLIPPVGVEFVPVQTALEMHDVVLRHLPRATVIIKAAAVADYYLPQIPAAKRKKSGAGLTLQLEQTPDILAEVGRRKGNRFLVGFAAETDNLLAEARRKLETKGCDLIVGNLVNRPGTGFDSDSNEVLIVAPATEPVSIGPAPKREIASKILDRVFIHKAAFSPQ